MNKWQLVILWIVGLYVSIVISGTGLKLLVHTEKNPETLATGYPLTLLAGTAWAYIVPIVVIGALFMITFWGKKK